MPSRNDIFFNGGIYHIFNKTIDNKNIFGMSNLSEQFLELMVYYRSLKADIRYSHFKELTDCLKQKKWKEIQFQKYFKVEHLCFCLMPNHFHLLIKQKEEDGVIRYMSDLINSFTRFYNILNNRKGPIFLTQFKSKRIKNREQLVHVSRYIHLNTYSSGIVKTIHELEQYSLSSYQEYISDRENMKCNTQIILNQFSGDKEKYRNFVLNNAEYQKTLEEIKHIDKW